MIKDDGNVIHFLNPKGTENNYILDSIFSQVFVLKYYMTSQYIPL